VPAVHLLAEMLDQVTHRRPPDLGQPRAVGKLRARDLVSLALASRSLLHRTEISLLNLILIYY
jgi:hypothetical protein